ncbi:hypothetical protein ACQY0O_007958 [Thecaphora frezii]
MNRISDKMPALFSKRPGRGKSTPNLNKNHFGSISSNDIDRLDQLSLSSSNADARPLPGVPTKEDLAPLPLSTNNSYLNVNTASLGSHSNDAEFGKLSSPSLRGKVSTPDLPVMTSEPKKPSSLHLGIQSAAFNSLRRSKSKNSENLRPISPLSPSSVELSLRSPGDGRKPNDTYTYGYTPQSTEVQLDPARVLPLLEVCGDQIRRRGLDSPLIFSSMALDLNPDNTASLIRAYQSSGPYTHRQALSAAFQEEVQYANSHDLAAVIKWAFARMGRVLAVPVPSSIPTKKGEVREEMVYIQQRGFLDLDHYNVWRESERRSRYSPESFNSFSQQLQPVSAQLLSSLFSLLSSTASYSLKNGMVPAKLAKHFGPLLFGLPEDETFARTYDAYVRASNATEHLLLAYIRSQAVVSAQPPKLMDHVAGYPAMLATDLGMPGKHAKLVPLTQIERQVRLYSPDLIQTACETDLTVECPEWEACRYDSERHGKDPQLSDRFRKLVNLRGGGAQGRTKSPSGLVAFAQKAAEDSDVKVYGSLVSKQWGDFLSEGFTTPDETKLAFDLNESARKDRHIKRDSVAWNDFQSIGFDTGDDGLDTVLSFDEGLKQEVEKWPGERDRILAKLRERQKALPPFHYDTTPRLLASPTRSGEPAGAMECHPISRMDEAFAEVWADYLIGAGWSNRDELTHRAANFAVLQYKSRPGPSTVGSQSAGSSLAAPTCFVVPRRDEFGQDIPEDPRTDAAWFVLQEVVPQLYRAELEVAGRGRSKGNAMVRKLNLFRSRKERSQDAFAGSETDPFRPGYIGETKHIRLSDIGSRSDALDNVDRFDQSSEGRPLRSTLNHSHSRLHVSEEAQATQHGRRSADGNPPQSRSEIINGTGQRLMSSLRAKSMRVVKGAKKGSALLEATFQPNAAPATPSKERHTQNGGHGVDASFTSEDFETRSLRDSDDPDFEQGKGSQQRKRKNLGGLLNAEKRDSKDDAWIDVLVKAGEQRMSGQDMAFREPNRTHNADRDAKAGEDPSSTNSVKRTQLEVDTSSISRDTNASFDTPRASTPPQAPFADNGSKLREAAMSENELERIDSPSSSRAELDSRYLDRSTSTLDASSKADTADTSLMVPTLTGESLSGRSSPLQASPVISGHSPLRSKLRPVLNSDKTTSSIDTKALVESLRAGLSPIEAVRKSKTSSGSQPASEPLAAANRIDPFSKDRTAGRVANVASRFGGPAGAKNGPKVALEPLLPSRANPISPPPKSPKRALAAASATSSSNGDVSSILTDLAQSSPRRATLSDAEPLSPTKTIDSYADQDSIYPEDAASNYHYSGEQPEEEEELVDAPRQWRLVPRSGDNGQGFTEDFGRAEEEDEVYAMPSGFREPYQPGMPLDNVMEESESVLSGSNL